MTTTPDRIWVTPRDEKCNWIGDAYSAPDPDYDAPQIEYVRADLVQRDLRDWFAGQALAGIVGPNYDWFTSGGETGSRTHEAAQFAYSLADAMLAARGAA